MERPKQVDPLLVAADALFPLPGERGKGAANFLRAGPIRLRGAVGPGRLGVRVYGRDGLRFPRGCFRLFARSRFWNGANPSLADPDRAAFNHDSTGFNIAEQASG